MERTLQSQDAYKTINVLIDNVTCRISQAYRVRLLAKPTAFSNISFMEAQSKKIADEKGMQV